MLQKWEAKCILLGTIEREAKPLPLFDGLWTMVENGRNSTLYNLLVQSIYYILQDSTLTRQVLSSGRRINE